MKQMQTIMSTPEQRQIIWDRRRAQMDYDTIISGTRLETLADLVRTNDLSMLKAAEKAKMSINEFAKKTGLPLPQS